mmetsp:Transcript_59206/g.190473  ORF Transcript_59206/g.190473 Transcript_59206/m.190473 type:complete len:616 (-) Transcript_59206:357-2204(-)
MMSAIFLAARAPSGSPPMRMSNSLPSMPGFRNRGISCESVQRVFPLQTFDLSISSRSSFAGSLVLCSATHASYSSWLTGTRFSAFNAMSSSPGCAGRPPRSATRWPKVLGAAATAVPTTRQRPPKSSAMGSAAGNTMPCTRPSGEGTATDCIWPCAGPSAVLLMPPPGCKASDPNSPCRGASGATKGAGREGRGCCFRCPLAASLRRAWRVGARNVTGPGSCASHLGAPQAPVDLLLFSLTPVSLGVADPETTAASLRGSSQLLSNPSDDLVPTSSNQLIQSSQSGSATTDLVRGKCQAGSARRLGGRLSPAWASLTGLWALVSVAAFPALGGTPLAGSASCARIREAFRMAREYTVHHCAPASRLLSTGPASCATGSSSAASATCGCSPLSERARSSSSSGASSGGGATPCAGAGPGAASPPGVCAASLQSGVAGLLSSVPAASPLRPGSVASCVRGPREGPLSAAPSVALALQAVRPVGESLSGGWRVASSARPEVCLGRLFGRCFGRRSAASISSSSRMCRSASASPAGSAVLVSAASAGAPATLLGQPRPCGRGTALDLRVECHVSSYLVQPTECSSWSTTDLNSSAASPDSVLTASCSSDPSWSANRTLP